MNMNGLTSNLNRNLEGFMRQNLWYDFHKGRNDHTFLHAGTFRSTISSDRM